MIITNKWDWNRGGGSNSVIIIIITHVLQQKFVIQIITIVIMYRRSALFSRNSTMSIVEQWQVVAWWPPRSLDTGAVTSTQDWTTYTQHRHTSVNTANAQYGGMNFHKKCTYVFMYSLATRQIDIIIRIVYSQNNINSMWPKSDHAHTPTVM